MIPDYGQGNVPPSSTNEPPRVVEAICLDREYQCPRCGTKVPPVVTKFLDSTGVTILIVGLFLFVVGAIFALLFIKTKAICPICGYSRQLD